MCSLIISKPSPAKTEQRMKCENRSCSVFFLAFSTAAASMSLRPVPVLLLFFYNRAVARGQVSPSHSGNSSCLLSPRVAVHVRKVDHRHTGENLLQCSMRGMTQNAEKSFHAIIWQRCPKHIFLGVNRFKVATALAVATINKGSRALRELLFACGCSM